MAMTIRSSMRVNPVISTLRLEASFLLKELSAAPIRTAQNQTTLIGFSGISLLNFTRLRVLFDPEKACFFFQSVVVFHRLIKNGLLFSAQFLSSDSDRKLADRLFGLNPAYLVLKGGNHLIDFRLFVDQKISFTNAQGSRDISLGDSLSNGAKTGEGACNLVGDKDEVNPENHERH